VRFAPDDDQLALREAARDLLAERCPTSAVRRCFAPDGPGHDPSLWAELARMGVLGLLAPESAGGLGLGPVELVLILEESGRVGLPGPLVEHAAVAVPALAEGGHPALAAAAAGSVLVSAAAAGAPVTAAGEVGLLLLERDGVVHAVAPSAARIEPRSGVDLAHRTADVSWPSDAGEPLPGVDVAALRARGALGCAAQLVGLASRMLTMTVEYVKERRQFGVPVGSQQAVKHHLADALIRLEHARPVVWRAAYALAHGEPGAARDCSFAKVYAGGAAYTAGRAALQCHGAIGYTLEHDLHLFLKRSWALDASWGTRAEHRAAVAAALLDGPLPAD
jgi:alkylation response protein AidB-like acyl-CoA dehydrogenase